MTKNNYIMIIATALLLLGILPNSLKSQQLLGKWIIPTTKYQANFTTHELTFTDDGVEINSTLMPPTYDPVEFSAGGYNENYQLNFYVLGEDVYNITANSGTNYQDWIPSTYGELHPEYQIIPKPGSQNQYYSFYTGIVIASKATEIFFYYNEITYGTNTLSFSENNRIHSNIRANGGYVAFAISDDNYLYASTPSSNASSPYNLAALRKWEITSTGINFIESIVDQTTSGLDEQDFDAYNLEVKKEIDNDVVIAWIHGKDDYANGFDVSELVVVTDGIGAKYPLGLGRLAGIEFSLYEDNIIYVSSNSGLYKVNYTNGTVIYPAIVQNNFSKTFVQTAPDGHIYAASDDGKTLGRIYQYSEGSYNQGDFLATAIDFPSDHKISSVCELVNNQEYYILPENHRRLQPLVVDIIFQDVSCPGYTDGWAKVYVEGGAQFSPPADPYTIECTTHPSVVFTWNSNDNCFEAFNLAEGHYSCVVTDASGNYEVVDFTIEYDKSDYDYMDHVVLGETYETYTVPLSFNNETVKFAEGFTVREGTNATFTNCTVLMGARAEIFVESGTVEDLQHGITGINGAVLTINNTTISNHQACNLAWEGIEVWGIRNKSQLPGENGLVYQGKLIVENDSEISNAYNAIKNRNGDDFNTSGGIILVEDCDFINNKRSIELLSYYNTNPYSPDIRLPYISKFKLCNFYYNDDYIIPEDFNAHFTMWDVEGVKLYGCLFENTTTNNKLSGYGLLTIDAGYSLRDCCTSDFDPCPEINLIRCSFFNLFEGVHASNTEYNNNRPFVNNAYFENNSTGVYLSNVKNAEIINSEFEIGPNIKNVPNCGDLVSGFGIDAVRSYGFIFENNEFNKYEYATDGYYSGIHLNSCPSPHDIIYKNKFVGLSFANYTEGTNRDDSNNDERGVEYRCNYNESNWIDLMVDNINDEHPDGMIRQQMGTGEIASANRFSQETENHLHVKNCGKRDIDFMHWQDDPQYFYPLIPEKVDGLVFASDNSNNVMQNLCPDLHGGTGGSILLSSSQRVSKEIEFADNLADYNSVLSLYESLEDGGNTTGELLDIETATPDETMELRNQLLGDSPHLSQEVLMAMSDRTDVLPNDIIFEILSANPDELKKDTLISYLENKEEPLPDYMINILKQLAYTTTTYKTILLNDMDYYFTRKMQAAKSIIHSIISDSIVDQQDYRNWLDNMSCLSADKQIVASYLFEDDTTSALQLLNIIPSNYNLDGDELTEYNDYKEMILLQLAWKNQGKSILSLDSSDISLLEHYAYNTTGSASYSAKNILTAGYNYYFCDCLSGIDTAGMKSINTSGVIQNINFDVDITVNPNPASNWASFNFILFSDKSTGVISVTDINGKEVYKFEVSGKQGIKIWATKNVKPGIYIYTLTSQGSSKSGKLVIQ